MKNLKSFIYAVSAAVLMVACSSAGRPEDSLKQFFDALAHKKFDDAAKLTTPASAATMAQLKTAAEMQGKTVEEQVANAKKLKYGEPQIKGDSAFVDVQNDKISKPMVYTLVRKDGRWLLDFAPSSLKRMMSKQ